MEGFNLREKISVWIYPQRPKIAGCWDKYARPILV
jgi:hypothetical protein